jgi:hypothetical protein
VPVGQFETYKTLCNLGLNFDYEFDISWDLDPGNMSRAQKIIELIDHLNQFEVAQLERMTLGNNLHNQNYIVSGKFYTQCQQQNDKTVEEIFKLIC